MSQGGGPDQESMTTFIVDQEVGVIQARVLELSKESLSRKVKQEMTDATGQEKTVIISYEGENTEIL